MSEAFYRFNIIGKWIFFCELLNPGTDDSLKPSRAYHKIDTFHGEWRWIGHKVSPWRMHCTYCGVPKGTSRDEVMLNSTCLLLRCPYYKPLLWFMSNLFHTFEKIKRYMHFLHQIRFFYYQNWRQMQAIIQNLEFQKMYLWKSIFSKIQPQIVLSHYEADNMNLNHWE